MTNHNVLVFGSFTEDEIKSFQSQPIQNDIDITFGSLDTATLRSVGIFGTRQIDIGTPKSPLPSKLINIRDAQTTATVCNAKELSSLVQQHENIHDSSPTQCFVVQGSESNNVQLHVPSVSGCTSDFLEPHGWNQNGNNGARTSSKAPAVYSLINSLGVFGHASSKQFLFSSSNGLAAKVTTLLPRGLVNLGNSCFLNATLQALLSCSPFVQLLQELKTCIPQTGYPTLRAFVELKSDFEMPLDISLNNKDVAETGKPFRPIMFESVLNNFSPDIPNRFSGRSRQEDAQEFLSFVLHQMHDELIKLEGQIPNGNEAHVSLVSSVSDEDDDSWETVGRKNKTSITRKQSFIPSRLSTIFGGQVRSVVKATGNKPSATIQPFLLLHLNIFPEPVCSIEDALDFFSAPETLEGYYRASAAGQAELVSASKSVKILELPEIIILHLMRFTYGSQGSTKLLKPVQFHLDLVLGREMLVSPTSEGRSYELVATISHHGREPTKGHYTADVLHSSGKWLRCDDASVVAIPTSKVLHDQAYLLFYKRL